MGGTPPRQGIHFWSARLMGSVVCVANYFFRGFLPRFSASPGSAASRRPFDFSAHCTADLLNLIRPRARARQGVKNFFFSIRVVLRPFEDFCRHKPWAIPRIRRHLSTESGSSPYTESLSGQTPSIRFAFGADDYVGAVSAGLPVRRARYQCFQPPDAHVCFFRYISPPASSPVLSTFSAPATLQMALRLLLKFSVHRTDYLYRENIPLVANQRVIILVAMYALRFRDELLRVRTSGVSSRKSPAGFTTVSTQMFSWLLLKLSMFPTDDLYQYTSDRIFHQSVVVFIPVNAPGAGNKLLGC